MTSALRNSHATSDQHALRRQQAWKRTADAVLATSPLDLRSALTLCQDILRVEQNGALALQGHKALSALRQLQHRPASQLLVRGAVREFRALQSELHKVKRPPFGKFDSSRSFTAERKLLGLSMAGQLTPADINAAFRAAANSAHPDRGGSADRFRELVTARDTLLKAAI